VTITNTPRQKDITIYAASEAEAEEKTIALVTSWDGVDDVEVDSVDED
jgi:hypothetical protein